MALDPPPDLKLDPPPKLLPIWENWLNLRCTQEMYAKLNERMMEEFNNLVSDEGSVNGLLQVGAETVTRVRQLKLIADIAYFPWTASEKVFAAQREENRKREELEAEMDSTASSEA